MPLALERKPQRGLEFELELKTLGPGGLGRGELAVEIGPQRLQRCYRVDVRGAFPGERVRVRVSGLHRRAIDGELLALLEQNPRRQAARCRHVFAPDDDQTTRRRSCGGCVLQQLPHHEQLALKAQRIAELLAASQIDPTLLRAPRAARQPWFYRNKMEYSFARGRQNELELGLHPPGYKYEVLPLSECHLLSPEASALLPRIGRWAADFGLRPYEHRADRGFLRTLTIREGKRTGERLVELLTTDTPEAETAQGKRAAEDVAADFSAALRSIAGDIGAEITTIYWTQQRARRGEPTRFLEHLLYGGPVLHEELHLSGVETTGTTRRALRFEIHPRAFFQPNTLQAEVLYGEVIAATGLDLIAGESPPRVLDLYCGTGTIALCLAAQAREVIGVELSADAVKNARRNAVQNAIDNVVFHAGDVGKLLDGVLAAERGKIDVVVVDPPRSGLGPQAREHIGRLGAPRLVYVSCNPEALAKDLLALRRIGLEARYVQPVDMFPHTGHIENVALLTRSSSRC